MLKVSVIIPCFNLGEYLNEAIDSVLAQTFQNFEIIIINDGSTDKKTNQIINSLNNPKIRVIRTSNQGFSQARNIGILQSLGKYILPLDADDKIEPFYLEKAVKILDKDENVGIVYSDAMVFGEASGKWILPEYSLREMLLQNLIFVSGVYRKADWEKVKGYKSNMIYGWEDYDFWLSIIELDRKVYKIPEVLFFYRKRFNSVSNRMLNSHRLYSYKQLFKNHPQLYIDNIEDIFDHMCMLKENKDFLLKDNLKLLRHQLVLQRENFNLKILFFHLLKFVLIKTSLFLGIAPEGWKSIFGDLSPAVNTIKNENETTS